MRHDFDIHKVKNGLGRVYYNGWFQGRHVSRALDNGLELIQETSNDGMEPEDFDTEAEARKETGRLVRAFVRTKKIEQRIHVATLRFSVSEIVTKSGAEDKDG